MMRVANAWQFPVITAFAINRRIMRRTGHAFLTGALLLSIPAVASERVTLVAEEYTVPALDSGIELFVRNKRPADMTAYAAERTVLFVHGSTYPASTTFDLQLEGKSWMDFIAEQGFDVYLMDLRGYGRSTRPQVMNEPPARNDPIVTTSEAVRDLEAVVDNVLKRRRIAKLSLIGWSWGTSITASYAVRHPERVQRLVFYGPQWIVRNGSPGGNGGKPGAYHTISRDAARERWLASAPQDKQDDLIPSGWFDQWADATFASDPVGAAQEPPVLRAPSGTVLDSQSYWRAGKPFYDPRRITVPVLLVHGEWDRNTPPYMSNALLPLLSNAPSRRRVVIPEATHMAMLEKNRMQLFAAVQHFLEKERAPQPEKQVQALSDKGKSAPSKEPSASRALVPPSKGVAALRRAAEPLHTTAPNVDRLMERGKALLEQRDPAAARLFFERAAADGHAGAMRSVGRTFDPFELRGLGIIGATGDPARAIEWYRRAVEAGDGAAAGLITRLSDRASSGNGTVRRAASEKR
jgi:pimeloyl-ACP methyl ester carboxylesterase